ncbi:hypothetical protein [Streptomyces griseorubiginosus]|uniref:hypothetical protein n=1 Tax=Streptomyces griseorubiginosus TaxID=67304 RepID=UPI001AD7444E|nr:hypothetical protein [Streptomyces griseorubiginosus]MBO4253205.1 hypothetical protein [Streptomyces griseorubiginosus]
MADGLSDGFRYNITHTHVTGQAGDTTRTATLVGTAGSLERFADRVNERSEFCGHCDARLRVVLRSTAEVRRRRRAHRLLWPVWAVLATLSGWGLVEVLRTGDGRGRADLLALVTLAGTVLLGYATLRSLILTRGFDTPEVRRTDRREPDGVRHGWRAPRQTDAGERTA